MPTAVTADFPDTVSIPVPAQTAAAKDTPNAVEVVNYELPVERIAQTPMSPRDASRLLVVERHNAAVPLLHKTFRELPDLLAAGDLLVVNETRVSALRLFGTRPQTGGQVEVLLLRPATEVGSANTWACLVKPGRKIQIGDRVEFADAGLAAYVLDRTPDGGRVLQFVLAANGQSDETEAVEARLQEAGRVPLPPYITAPLADASRYQTVYAHAPGSAAAPTAGLHFTPELLARVEAKGVNIAKVRLDVGLGTFRPMRSNNPAEHEMHRETFGVPEETARAVNECRGRVIAVGTTSLRALETAGLAAAADGTDSTVRVRAMEGETGLFVYPGSGHVFRAVDGLITNFHQPHSTLLLLVAAFCGPSTMRRAYQTALNENYRFLSFGDAMIALPNANKN